MSRTFNNSTSNRLSASSIFSGFTWAGSEKFALAGWYNGADDAAGHNIACLSSAAPPAAGEMRLDVRMDVASNPARVVQDGSGTALASSTAGFSASTWGHAFGLFQRGVTPRRSVYFDGANSATNDTAAAQVPDRTGVGCLPRTTPALPANGSIAEVAMWFGTTQLDAQDALSLAHGCSPLLVRPTDLAEYWPLFNGYSTGDEASWISGGVTLTETGTVGNAAHPSAVAYPVP